MHSLSDRYVDKQLALAAQHWDAHWIYDGGALSSLRARPVKKGEGVKNRLRTMAFDIHMGTGGLVHYNGKLWEHWLDNIWFPDRSWDARNLLAGYEAERRPMLRATTLHRSS